MLDKNKSIIKSLLIVFIFFFSFIILFYISYERRDLSTVLSFVNGDEIFSFNHDSGIYNKEIKLKIKKNRLIPKNASIYYTTDGSNPSMDSTEYTKEIKLSLDDEKYKIYYLKFTLCYKSECSEFADKTYIISKDNMKSFNIPIITLNTDSNNLFDENSGLFVQRNYYVRDNSFAKKTKMSLFDKDGNVSINQNIGIILSGNASVWQDVKSLKLIAGYEYDSKNDKFDYSFDTYESEIYQPIKYNTLRLSSGGQDNVYTNIRNNAIYDLAKEAGFDGYRDSQRVLVFLNNSFYGVMSLEQSFSDSFLKKRYNLSTKDIEKYKGSVKTSFKKADLYKYLDDLNDDTVRNEFEEKVDIDNLLKYYTIEFLVKNSDFPTKNFEIWRYTGEYDKNNKYSDGKYRCLLYDLDFSYFSSDMNVYWKNWDVGVDSFDVLIHNDDTVFYKLMKNKDYRYKFITMLRTELGTVFYTDNIVNKFTEEYNKIYKLNEYFLSEERFNNFVSYFEDTINEIGKRENQIDKIVSSGFDLQEKYTLNIVTSEGSYANIYDYKIYQNLDYRNTYYKYSKMKITFDSYPGYDFDYLVVNGKKIYKKELNVSKKMIDDNKLTIEVHSKRNNINLIIKEIKYNGGEDYIVIKNISNKKLPLMNYYLSDDRKNLKKYNLSSKTIKSSEERTVFGKDNLNSFGDLIANFNLKDYETLYLYNSKTDTIEDLVYLPRLNKCEVYFRYDDSDTFKIVLK